MSKDTWLNEHYATPAKHVLAKDALAHSIKKWEGLTQRELAHHGLEQPPIAVDGSTCALCHHFYETRADIAEQIEDCDDCPIVEYQGFPCTMSSRSNDEDSPYSKWKSQGNPIPMISLLWRTAEATGADLTSLGDANPHDEDTNTGELSAPRNV